MHGSQITYAKLLAPRVSLLVIVGVHLSEVLPLFRKIVFGEDGLYGASRFAGAAINALVRVDIKQLGGLKCGLVLAWMNAVYRTDVHTSGVLSPYAGFSDNVRH